MKTTKCINGYVHSGIILDQVGKIFEVVDRVKKRNLLINYKDREVLIARYALMDEELFNIGYDCVKKHNGERFSKLRTLLHMFGVSKYIHWNRLTPDEFVAKFLHNAMKMDSIFEFEKYWGFDTDSLYNLFNLCEQFEIVYDGKIE